jgi:hypothetical protein
MDGLEPSTLYAPSGGHCLAGASRLGAWLKGAGIPPDAQFSLYAIQCHYRRPKTGRPNFVLDSKGQSQERLLLNKLRPTFTLGLIPLAVN